MSKTTYGTGATKYSNGSSRLVKTLSKKSKPKKKYKHKRKK